MEANQDGSGRQRLFSHLRLPRRTDPNSVDVPTPPRKQTAVSAPHDTFEASRLDKLRRIEELGIDPWGGRFDGHQPIEEIRALPADLPEGQRPRVRAAGRILLRRDMGNAHFLQLGDWTGR